MLPGEGNIANGLVEDTLLVRLPIKAGLGIGTLGMRLLGPIGEDRSSLTVRSVR